MREITILFVLLSLLNISCEQERFTTLSGNTMGTYYTIQYKSENNYQNQIDSILQGFIAAASTYDPNSELSQFNQRGSIIFRKGHLYRMLIEARKFHKMTAGAFEPTLMPLINAYGFGYTKKSFVSNSRNDSLLQLVSFHHVYFDSSRMTALKKGIQVDLSAMGEGYAIDLIADFLEQERVSDYKVEIGGEMKCKGKNPKSDLWLIGIENPEPQNQNEKILKYLTLHNEAISTSGNYKKYYIDNNGKKRSHLIDPKTGEPIDNTLLSVTITDKRATVADAMATACMVMGLDSAIAFIQKSNLKGLITFEKNGKVQSWHSKDFFSHTSDKRLVSR